MSISTYIKLRDKGTLTLPIELRRKYGYEEGDMITLIDLGEGSILLTHAAVQMDRLGDRIARTLTEEGVSLDEILAALDEERERYYQERYAGA